MTRAKKGIENGVEIRKTSQSGCYGRAIAMETEANQMLGAANRCTHDSRTTRTRRVKVICRVGLYACISVH